MTIKTETSLRNFHFWGGAAENVKYFTEDELDILDGCIDDLGLSADDCLTETEVNDLFWFEPETLCEWLADNMEDGETLWEERLAQKDE